MDLSNTRTQASGQSPSLYHPSPEFRHSPHKPLIALVTGASGSIGGEVARRLARDGVEVAICCHQRTAEGAEVARAVQAFGCRSVMLTADLSQVQGCTQLVEDCCRLLGAPDILVHCAGEAHYALLLDTTPEEWDRLFAVHVRSAFLLAKAVLPAMLRRQWGRIILISSIWGLIGAANETAYSAAKAAQIGLVKSLAKEVARGGVTVNAVAPGAVAGRMLTHLSESELSALTSEVPMGRLGTAADVAAAVAFLSSAESDYISGQVLSPNGAMVV